MKKTIVMILIFGISIFASDPNIILGYGSAKVNLPILKKDSIGSQKMSIGLTQKFSKNETDKLTLTGVLSSTRDKDKALLSELELQVGLTKQLTKHQSIEIGGQVMHLLNENIDKVELKSFGFGIYMGYTFKLFQAMSMKLSVESHSYHVNSDEIGDRLTNQSITSQIIFGL